jgi:hypothetical protein
MSRTLVLDYDGETVAFDVHGDTAWGDNRVLVAEDDDLVASCAWADQGFTIARFLDPPDFTTLADGLRRLVVAAIRQANIEAPDDFALDRYHEIVTSEDAHRQVAEVIRRCFPLDQLPIPASRIEHRVSEILGVAVGVAPPHSEFPPHFCLRVVRPRSGDNNPPHRDVWLDRLRHAVNIYAPLAGSSARSSLPLVPGSHHWRESEIERTASGAQINGVVYTVPSVVGASRPLTLVRPNPALNEVLVFSPYLIHGGAFNQQHDQTRVSLEMRFWRQAVPGANAPH